MDKGARAWTRTACTRLDARIGRVGIDYRRGSQKVARVKRRHVGQNEAVLCSGGGLGAWLVMRLAATLLLLLLLLLRLSSNHFLSTKP